jgi:hypothetical protein
LAGYVAHVKVISAYRTSVGNRKEKYYSGDLGIAGGIIFKRAL